MIGLLDVPKLIAACAIGMVIAGPIAYWQGKSHQRQIMAIEALSASVKILRKKGEIDNAVSNSSAADLCGSYGLPDDEERECVRLVKAAAAEAGNDGFYSPER